MENLRISDAAVKDYFFDYDAEIDKTSGPAITKSNPKKLLNGIDLKELLNGNDVTFEVVKDYDESVLEQEDPDVFNEVIFSDCTEKREKRGPFPLNCSFKSILPNFVNLTENGFVKKEVITKGIGETVPDNAYVIVHYNLYKEGCEYPFDSTYMRNRPEKFRLDQGQTIEGLEYAIKSMKKNENSRFFIKWEYAFGALGCPDRIEPKCDIIAEVTLLNVTEAKERVNGVEHSELLKEDFKQALNTVKELHCDGSEFFKKEAYKKAISWKALRILDEVNLNDTEEEMEMLAQKEKCLVNLAIVYNKIGKFEQACLACRDALSINSKNAKACFHYGRATLGLSNFSMSQKWLKKAAKLKPNDLDIMKELKKLDEKKGIHKVIDKNFWERAFEDTRRSLGKNAEGNVE